jgi:hypothetical protein
MGTANHSSLKPPMADTRVLNQHVWRFAPGERCYVRHWPKDAQAVITQRFNHQKWPHYFAVCPDGYEYQLPQIHLSRTPIHLDA